MKTLTAMERVTHAEDEKQEMQLALEKGNEERASGGAGTVQRRRGGHQIQLLLQEANAPAKHGSALSEQSTCTKAQAPTSF